MEKSRISFIDDELQELTKNSITEKDFDGHDLYFHNNTFWCSEYLFKSIVSFQTHFQAKDTDIILATGMKSGTTWLKALTFTIMNRAKYSPKTQTVNPLFTSNPHDLIPTCEIAIYLKDQNPNLDHLPSPRIFQTHVPFSALPKSILDSECRIVHICRNPLDYFVSYWHFMLKMFEKEHADDDTIEMTCINEAFELFCRGVHRFGPFAETTLGFWRASIENPERVLFLKYEDLQNDIISEVKKIAEFLGCEFSMEEDKQGVVEEIANICSYENLKNLQVNQEGQLEEGPKNSIFFRNGKVGDWVNFISPSQAERLKNITKEKLNGSGLMFKYL